MTQPRIFHGPVTPRHFALALMGEFNRGNLRAHQVGASREILVQIMSLERPASGGRTALTVTLRQVEDGVAVQVGQQSWMGVAASLGQTLMATLMSPWNLLGRLDDLAQDFENMQMVERVWDVLEGTARAQGATFELSERLRRLTCEYCQVANPVGEAACIACGAPLGRAQPRTCRNCGFVIKAGERTCPNCGRAL